MKRKTFFSAFVASVVVLLLVAGGAKAEAQPPLPSGPHNNLHRPLRSSPDGHWIISQDGEVIEAVPQPDNYGGPDEFGYTWDDSVPMDWVDTAGGIGTGLSPSKMHVGPVYLGFNFKYYEHTYNKVYISLNGMVSFQSNCLDWSADPIPRTWCPNDVIAPFWSYVTSVGGYVHYLRGGESPHRWFVVEWNHVKSDDDDFTFEVVIHENGDIVFQYKDVTYRDGHWCESSGIEDSLGIDGLSVTSYCRRIESDHAVLIKRPAPSARLKIFPKYLGSFAYPAEVVTFTVPIANIGDLGTDTFDIATESFWPLSLFHADGTTPLTDTDGDGVKDTGAVQQGESTDIVAKISVPSSVEVGARDEGVLTVRSSLNANTQERVVLQSAVPSAFVQSYETGCSDNLDLVRPVARTTYKNAACGWNPAVAETADGGFVQVWTAWTCHGRCFEEMHYTLTDPYGDVVRPESLLTTTAGISTTMIYNEEPAVAVAPAGRIGVVWQREIYNSENQFNYNIYFAVLDSHGDLVYGPENVTHNDIWGRRWDDLNVPRFYAPAIEATRNDKFVLAWEQYYYGPPNDRCGGNCPVDDIWYAVRDIDGRQVKGNTKLTNDTPGWDDNYYYPTLASLSHDQALLTFTRHGNYMDIYYVVLDDHGNVVKPMTDLSNDLGERYDRSSDAAQLQNGYVVVAWISQEGVRFAILDPQYNRVGTPRLLSTPVARNGADYVSVVRTSANRAVITWQDGWRLRMHLYYALVDWKGDVLTPPTIFRTGEGYPPSIYAGRTGAGNAPFDWTPPSGVDSAVAWDRATYSGLSGETVRMRINVSGRGEEMASGVVLTATLGSNLQYLGDTSACPHRIRGNEVMWDLPDLRLFDRHSFVLSLLINDGEIGDRLPVSLEISSSEEDVNPGDNESTAYVQVYGALYMPVILH